MRTSPKASAIIARTRAARVAHARLFLFSTPISTGRHDSPDSAVILPPPIFFIFLLCFSSVISIRYSF